MVTKSEMASRERADAITISPFSCMNSMSSWPKLIHALVTAKSD